MGHAPDPRAQEVAARAGIDISDLRARQVRAGDFHDFDHIIAMDHENLANLRRLAPSGGSARLSLLLDHVPGREGQSVADPYFGEAAGFDATWCDVTMGAQALLRLIVRQE